MGQQTDRIIREFRERAGLEVPGHERRQLLEKMKRDAVNLIECIVLEESGIRDGDGQWHGCDPICAIVRNLVELERKDLAEWRKQADVTAVLGDTSGKAGPEIAKPEPTVSEI